MIITLTGPSGAGKTTIASKILELLPATKLVLSLTSRDPRPSDLPGEYLCNVTPKKFEALSRGGEFLWGPEEAHGNSYGTLRHSVDAALNGDPRSPNIMLLIPKVIPILLAYSLGKGTVLSCYIVPPPADELRRRLLKRGDDEAAIERRIRDCAEWEVEARVSHLPYVFISNEEPVVGVEKAAKEIIGIWKLL